MTEPSKDETTVTEADHEAAAAPEATTTTTKRRFPSFGSRGSAGGSRGGHDAAATVYAVRNLVAKVVWIVCVVFALLLALEVLLIAIKANPDNGLVKFDVKFTPHIDLHWFSLINPVKDFDKKKGPATDIKTALFNYGIAAIVWLLIGRVADAIIKPSGKPAAKSR